MTRILGYLVVAAITLASVAEAEELLIRPGPTLGKDALLSSASGISNYGNLRHLLTNPGSGGAN